MFLTVVVSGYLAIAQLSFKFLAEKFFSQTLLDLGEVSEYIPRNLLLVV